MRILLCVALTVTLTACATSNEDLEREIADAEGRIAALETQINDRTSSSSSLNRDLVARASLRPLVAWTQRFNALPQSRRTVSFQQTSFRGRIASRRFGCGIFGRGGWYVEFDRPNATIANARIGRTQIRASNNLVSLRADMDLDARSQLHWHFDPCIGGGVGGSVGISAKKDLQTEYQLRLGRMNGNSLPYSMALTRPQNISVTVRVHLGRIGTLGIPMEFGGVAQTLGEGNLRLSFANQGSVGPLPDGSTLTYSLSTRSPRVRATSQAIEADTDISISVR